MRKPKKGRRRGKQQNQGGNHWNRQLSVSERRKGLKKRIISLLMCGMMMAGLLTGCGNSKEDSQKEPESSGGQPYAGTKIHVLSAANMWAETVKENLPEFEAETGIKVDLQTLEDSQLSNKIAVSMAANGTDIDVFAFRPLQESQMFMDNGWLEALNPYYEGDTEYEIDDFYDASKELTIREEKLYGIPLMTERQVVYYNKELFEKAGITKLPETLEEFRETAEKLHDPEHGISGIVIRGKGPDAVTMVSSFLRDYGGEFMKDGKASIDTPEAIQGFRYYGDLLRNYGPDGVANMGWQESMAVFTQGLAGMRIDVDTQYAQINDPDSSQVAGKVGYFLMPKGPNGQHTFSITAWAVGINSQSKNKDAAWEFLRWATGKEMDVKAQAKGSSSARTSTWEEEDANASWPEELIPVIQKSMEIGDSTDRPILNNVGEARTYIGDVITAALFDEDVEAAAGKANEQFQSLLDAEKTK